MNCTNCGYEATGKKFCKRCGKPIVGVSLDASEEVRLPDTPKPKATLESPEYILNEVTLPQNPNALTHKQITSNQPNSKPPVEGSLDTSEEKTLPSTHETTLEGEKKLLPSISKPTSGKLEQPPPTPLKKIEGKSVAERISNSTKVEGLQSLPLGFDDKEGDWVTIHSNNLFERLYLDYKLYKQVTLEMVKSNYEMLNRFWQDKIDLINRGQRQIISKYDPEHKSEEVIKSFPRRLKEAFDVLSKPDGIRSYFNELDRKRKELGKNTLRKIIDTALVGGVLGIAATQMIFDEGKNTELTEEEVAEFLNERLKNNGFRPIGEPSGTTPKLRLLSVKWANQGYDELQSKKQPSADEILSSMLVLPAQPQQQILSVSKETALPKPINYIPFLLSITVLLFIIIGGTAFWLYKTPTPEPTMTPNSSSNNSNSSSSSSISNSVNIPKGMVYIPGGVFFMGKQEGDLYEQPVHKVTVAPFFIDFNEVTCDDYKNFIKATNYKTPMNWADGNYPLGAERRPVTGVTWDDASAYAKWLGKRLPTETEWEFAARGTDNRFYPWGKEWKTGLANAGSSGIGRMSDVGAYAGGVSPFGLFDMVGNAWEWTSSDLTVYPGGKIPKEKLEGYDEKYELKVIRGGYYGSTEAQATVTFRRGWPARNGPTYNNTGFRCAQDIDKSIQK